MATDAYQHLAEVAAAVSPTHLGFAHWQCPTPSKVVPQSILLREVDDAVSFAAAARATVPIVPLPDPAAATGRRRDLLAATFGVESHNTEFESGYGQSASQAPAALARRDTTHVLKRNDETAYAEAKIKMDCVLAGGKGRGASRGGRATGAGAAAPAPKARTSAAAPVTR